MNENDDIVKNEKKGKHIIIIVLLGLIILGLIGFICYDKGVFSVKKSSENNNIENSSSDKEQKVDNDDSNIYGFAYVSKNDKEYKIMALNSKGSDVELNSGEGSVTFYLKNNKLLFMNRRASFDEPTYVQKTYYVDLNVHPYKTIQLTEGVSIYDYFDFNSKYLFAHNSYADGKKGIKRYDFDTKEEVIFEEGVYANGIFIANNRVYYSTMDYSGNTPQEYYYSIDFDGKNKVNITKEEYDQVVAKSGYKEEIGTYNDVYFIKNNKKVYVDKDLHNLYLDDKVVYTSSKTSRSIVLEYSEDPNIICFREVTMNTGEVPPKSYFYHIDTDKLEEINENQVISFREIIK